MVLKCYLCGETFKEDDYISSFEQINVHNKHFERPELTELIMRAQTIMKTFEGPYTARELIDARKSIKQWKRDVYSSLAP